MAKNALELPQEEIVTPKFIQVAVSRDAGRVTIVGLDDEMNIWKWSSIASETRYKMRWVKLVSEP